MRVSIILIGLGLTLGLSTSVQAVEPDVKCEADKLKETGKYGFCRLKAESKAVKKGEATDYAKCVAKFTGKWPTIESKAGGACPTNQPDVNSQFHLLMRGPLEASNPHPFLHIMA